MHNNPAAVAFSEAGDMTAQQHDAIVPLYRHPNALISIGTGKAKENSVFSLRGLMLTAKKKLTDTEVVHTTLESTIGGGRSRTLYRRFNVAESELEDNLKGLASIKLDSCKKQKRKRHLPWPKTRELHNTKLEIEAMKGDDTNKYNPEHYRYKTFDQIRDRTLQFCNLGEVDGKAIRTEIHECARALVEYSRRRRDVDETRWEKFRTHPDPRYGRPN